MDIIPHFQSLLPLKVNVLPHFAGLYHLSNNHNDGGELLTGNKYEIILDLAVNNSSLVDIYN
jgi:hypothetical protein